MQGIRALLASGSRYRSRQAAPQAHSSNQEHVVIEETLLEAEEKMEKAVVVAKEDFAAIRTGRAHPAMFNKIVAEYYGTMTPINQLASFSVPEPRMAVVTRSTRARCATSSRRSATPTWASTRRTTGTSSGWCCRS